MRKTLLLIANATAIRRLIFLQNFKKLFNSTIKRLKNGISTCITKELLWNLITCDEEVVTEGTLIDEEIMEIK